MAEKYGTVPPKWTKEWWSYFWYYYKWYVIITAFVVLSVLFTAVQCATREKYDLTVTYAGHKIYTEDELNRFVGGVNEYIDDVDGNGEKSVFFQQLNFMDKSGSEEYDYASQTKLDLEFHNDCSFLFLYDLKELETMAGRDSASELYVPVSEWAEEMPEESLVYTKDGLPYAVNLKDSGFLAENSIYRDDLYVIVRRNYKDDEKNISAWENSVKIANNLIK